MGTPMPQSTLVPLKLEYLLKTSLSNVKDHNPKCLHVWNSIKKNLNFNLILNFCIHVPLPPSQPPLPTPVREGPPPCHTLHRCHTPQNVKLFKKENSNTFHQFKNF